MRLSTTVAEAEKKVLRTWGLLSPGPGRLGGLRLIEDARISRGWSDRDGAWVAWLCEHGGLTSREGKASRGGGVCGCRWEEGNGKTRGVAVGYDRKKGGNGGWVCSQAERTEWLSRGGEWASGLAERKRASGGLGVCVGGGRTRGRGFCRERGGGLVEEGGGFRQGQGTWAKDLWGGGGFRRGSGRSGNLGVGGVVGRSLTGKGLGLEQR